MAFEEIGARILASCLNLTIDECRMVRGASFSGARYLGLDRARLWYQWEFVLDWQITDADGVRRYRFRWNRSRSISSKRPPLPAICPRRCRYTDRRAAASARDRWTVAGARLFP